MIKYVFSILFILTTVTAFSQKKSVVNLIRSTSTENVRINGKDVVKVHQGVFQQDYSVMRSDSAYFYVQDNAFDAFGHVNITQGDTLNIFSDKLNYNGNTKVAILTDNVKMVDKDATLTTNYLTYNTATRIGTYTGGGKIVNKDNTLTSKNGYYFAFSRDAYFRYDVVEVTPDALIKTDTMRYNSGTRIAYFYGPTNIYDTKDKKDTLYTENGLYNTITEQAFFGKRNLYKSGTKRLKGDSLFYDKKAGLGRAVKHVIFTDSEQKTNLYGDLANYYKDEERTVVTQDPYVVIVTEERDTTAKDSVAPNAVKDVKGGKGKKVSPIKAPSLDAAKAPLGTPVKTTPPVSPIKAPALGTPVKALSTDTLAKRDTSIKVDSLAKLKPKEKTKHDSVYISADVLVTQMMTYKAYKDMIEKERLSRIRDTTKIKAANAKAGAKFRREELLVLRPPGSRRDSIMLPLLFGLPKKQATPVLAATGKADKGAKGRQQPKAANGQEQPPRELADEVDNDPVFKVRPITLSDTARIRIVKAYHNAKLFKSDLQAKSDSMFYSYADSTLRCFVNPLIWTQGSQLSGDTITLQMRNKKIDNLMMFPAAFIVNIEKDDSVNFNQVSGKRMRGFFKDDKLDRMYVSGNAESIYYSRDSGKVSGMERSLTTRMRILFKDNSATDVFNVTKPEHRYGPLAKFKEDERILKGFIWKPKERPISKESIIPSYSRKQAAAAAKNNKGKPPLKPGTSDKMPADTAKNKPPALLLPKGSKDSTGVKPAPLLKPAADKTIVKPAAKPVGGVKADTTKKQVKDTTAVKKP
ncbi:OstA-like protein [Mucilaginibacter terrenus]|uniref:OstA-like protein n=1 Tax=Mucilaginibacter terrenus TaxID=2482727 RepID=UPI001403D655|nr:OstA-like protein [Mucilaginibacter terrenus]